MCLSCWHPRLCIASRIFDLHIHLYVAVNLQHVVIRLHQMFLGRKCSLCLSCWHPRLSIAPPPPQTTSDFCKFYNGALFARALCNSIIITYLWCCLSLYWSLSRKIKTLCQLGNLIGLILVPILFINFWCKQKAQISAFKIRRFDQDCTSSDRM